MFKRVFWFAAGAAAGVAGIRRVEREVAERKAKLEPESVVNTAVEAAGRGADRVKSAFADGRAEMRRVTDELQATHDPSRRPPRVLSPRRDSSRNGPARSSIVEPIR